jgi:hypothetical protein
LFVVVERVEVFQKEQPRGLFGVVQLTRATGVFVQDVVDVFESLLKHGVNFYSRWVTRRGPNGAAEV